ncbi:hypothetical protein [Paenibacillus elgii]|uniref:hypothetical protein n=1 Tax=Paenibacillus elgii TaxID=189691 RepID=UPI000248C6D8|nr:hypothetical protein [Paenibacillus elgii]
MRKEAKLVSRFLMQNTNFTEKSSFFDRLNEIIESYETVPDDVFEAYEEISEYELWEIIRKLAVKGKQLTK